MTEELGEHGHHIEGAFSYPHPTYGSPFTVRFLGGPAGDGALFWIPLADLTHTPFVCSGDEEYSHFEQLGPPEDRTYVYAGPCADLNDRAHAHPGPSHGHD